MAVPHARRGARRGCRSLKRKGRRFSQLACRAPELEPARSRKLTVLPMRIFGLRPETHLHLTP